MQILHERNSEKGYGVPILGELNRQVTRETKEQNKVAIKPDAVNMKCVAQTK